MGLNAQNNTPSTPGYSIQNTPQTTPDFRSQNIIRERIPRDNFSWGVGGGFDFGGIGANLTAYPTKNLGLFVGVGYALAGVGYNVGAKFRMLSKKETSRVDPYFIGMYGYNVAVAIKDRPMLNKFFYGPSIGFGLDLLKNKYSYGYWSVALLVPIRRGEANAYINDLKNHQGITFSSDLLPIGFSIGYKVIFGASY